MTKYLKQMLLNHKRKNDGHKWCVEIVMTVFVFAHTQVSSKERKSVSLSYSIKSATAKNTAKRRRSRATQEHRTQCTTAAYLFLNRPLPQNETDPTVTGLLREENEQIGSLGVYFISHLIVNLLVDKCRNKHQTHTEGFSSKLTIHNI